MHMLIRADYLLPVSDSLGRSRRMRDGYVLTNGPLIEEAGEYSPEIGRGIIERFGGDLHVMGAEGTVSSEADIPRLPGVLLPGFVKAHGHDHESPIVGIAKDEPLTDWLDHAVNIFTGFMGEKREELTERFGRSPNLVTYLKARLDDIYYGITSSMVHHCNHNKYRVEEIVEANLTAGTKMIVAVGSQDRNYERRILDTPEEAVARLDSYIERFGSSERTWIIPGPDQFFSNGPEILKALKEWSRRNDTLIHIHSSEEPGTTRWFRETYGMTPVEYGESIGFLDERAVLAHQVNSTDHDIEILSSTGTNIVHNPLANTILGSGMPRVMEMIRLGIPVAISTDGSGSADNQNILSAARLASQYQKALHQDARLFTAQDVLERITIVPANILGLNSGSIEPGKDADIILIGLSSPNMTPTRIDNLVENLIWASDGSEVTHVIAGGRILVENGRFLTLDEDRIKSDVLLLSELLVDYMADAEEVTGTGKRG